MELAATVSGLFIYPIKGCRGISVSQACISSTGFRWDRQWMVVNSKLRSCTQRVEPKLALVEVELPAEAFSGGWEPEGDSVMVIRAPGMYALKIPLKKEHLVVDNVSVWEWSGSVLDEGHEASEWFSNYLGNHCRLVRFNSDSEVRAVDPKYSPGYKTMFSDGFPFLLISQGSLDALNERLEGTVPINRFRPKKKSIDRGAYEVMIDVNGHFGHLASSLMDVTHSRRTFGLCSKSARLSSTV